MILPSYDKMMIQDEESGENVLKYPKTPEGQEKKIQDAMQEIIRIIQSGAAGAMAKGGRAGYQGGEPGRRCPTCKKQFNQKGRWLSATSNPTRRKLLK